MRSRNPKRNHPESNFSRRGRDESPNQWNAYSRTESEKGQRETYRTDQKKWTGSDYDRPEGSNGFRDDERPHQMNHYPHSYGENDSRLDMESRRFGAHEGNSYLSDRSHEDSEPRPERSHGSTPKSFSGRGPKGFKRSDERIKEEVCEMLTRDHFINAEDIEVEVTDGEVTLSGSVSERRMKHLAEDCVERALGVKDVINNIRVKRDSSDDSTSNDKKSTTDSGSSTGNPKH